MPGPKPILKGQGEIDSLKRHVAFWIAALSAVRDGADGYINKIKWGPVEKFRGERLPPDDKQWLESVMIISRPGLPPLVRYGHSLGGFPLARTMSEKDLQEWRREENGWEYVPPISPAPQIWARLKRARTASELGSIADDLKAWADRQPVCHRIVDKQKSEDPRVPFLPAHLDVLRIHAKKILAAKTLWTYPRTSRPRSDDKRIEFFAESLAGLMFGLAPATAQRILSGWHWTMKEFHERRANYYELLKSLGEGAVLSAEDLARIPGSHEE